MAIWRTTEQVAGLFNVTPQYIRKLAKDEQRGNSDEQAANRCKWALCGCKLSD